LIVKGLILNNKSYEEQLILAVLMLMRKKRYCIVVWFIHNSVQTIKRVCFTY